MNWILPSTFNRSATCSAISDLSGTRTGVSSGTQSAEITGIPMCECPTRSTSSSTKKRTPPPNSEANHVSQIMNRPLVDLGLQSDETCRKPCRT